MLNAHRIKYTCNRTQELSNAGGGEGKGWLGERISSLQLRMEIPGVMERNGVKNINCVNNNNNNNKNFLNLQVANSPSRLRFEANLSRESSECTEHSQDQTSQINTGKTVYVGNA